MMTQTTAAPYRSWTVLGAISLGAILVLLLAPFVGERLISPTELSDRLPGGEGQIFFDLRVPRILLAFLAGAGLAVSGMAFQAMFRNPLATPFTLGVASGASLGAAIFLCLGLSASWFVLPGLSLFSLIGALLAILLVYGLTCARPGFSTSTMLLAGVAVNFTFSSLILLVHFMASSADSARIIKWLMGSLTNSTGSDVMRVAPFVICCSLVIFYLASELNLLSTGEDIARSRGVTVQKVRLALFLATSLIVAGIVSICGPIGFVGMMVPHFCRMLIGPDHRFLTPASFLLGGAFLTLCDRLSVVMVVGEIPVGIITALLGGPFFLWLLVKRGSSRIL